MSRKKKFLEPILVNEFSIEDIEGICDVLNGEDEPELQPALTRLVKSWQASGPNLSKMVDANDGLWWNTKESWKATWMPTNSGNAHLMLSPAISQDRMEKGEDGSYRATLEDRAIVLFYLLTINPEWDRLGGPCERCARYYIIKTTRNKRYCSRQCGSRATATASTRKRLDKEHADKLHRAKAAARLWLTSRTSLDWKQWVSRIEPEITPKWLTRALNKGELQSPPAKSFARRP